MARSSFTWLRAAAVAALAAQAAAQTCYYPNGKAAPDTEKPCSSADGAACCPDTWECLDNGLCHNPNGDLYGRYSCTDKTWKAPGCASNMCTYGGTAYGGESIEQCSGHNNDWCCNADAVHVNCCQESPEPRPFFRLQDGMAYATIGRNQASSQPTLATNTGLASGSGSGGGSSASKTDAPGSSAPTSAAKPVTSESTSVSSGPGGVSTVINTLIITPSVNPTANTNSNSAAASTDGGSGSKSNIGVIVGCAVGIPLALALGAIIFWILRKRRNQKAGLYKNSPEMDGESAHSPGFAGGAAAKLSKPEKYRHSRPGTTEIDGAPAGPGRPISHIPGHAELDSGAGFQSGHGAAFAPDTVGIGGGNGDGRSTWGSAPPGYSPDMNQTGFHHQPNVSELEGTSAMPVINEKAETAAHPQQYQAYRPPQPAAELPTIKTPPEDLEKQMPK